MQRDLSLGKSFGIPLKQPHRANIEKVATEIAQYITVDIAIHHGTRVPISIIIGSLPGGMSKEEVMQEYELTKTQLEAALSNAKDVSFQLKTF
jgi:uncharacterized protein (DUF433 family)